MSDKILIVDDSQMNRKLLFNVLGNTEYKLFEAVDGEEALDMCLDELPDLVLLDITMPKMDGYKVCEAIKSDPRTEDISVIFLSANTETPEKIKGLDLGAVDYITKPFDRGEVLARIRTQLRVRHLTYSLVEKQKHLEEDLQAAAEIQQSLLPKTSPEIKHFQFAWQFMPCQQIGGDIFNVHRLDESHLAAYVVDVSGHGVPSAMVTVSVSQSLLPQTGCALKKAMGNSPHYKIASPVEVLSGLDRNYPMERFDKYFTIVYLVLNVKTGHIRYSNAAHPWPVLVRASGEIELLEAGGPIIGMGTVVPFEEGEIYMRPGDRLFLYTDGIVECENQSEEFYGTEQLYHNLQQTRREPLDVACQYIINSVMAHSNGIASQDDITLFAIECQIPS